MRIAIFISSGLGNTIMLIPVVNRLKAQGHTVHGIFTSKYNCEQLFVHSDLWDRVSVLQKKREFLAFAISNRRKFDKIIMDVFACTRSHFWLAKKIAKKIIAQSSDVESINKRVHYIPPVEEYHGALDNLNMINITEVEQDDFNFLSPVEKENYIVFQPGSGNNLTPWKNWAIENWVEVLKELNYPIKVIGDDNEYSYAEILFKEDMENVEILIGEQNITEMVETVRHAGLYIGHDSGPMHIAIANQVPTFTVWGGSPYIKYAYDKLFPKTNKVVRGKATSGKESLIEGLRPEYVSSKLQQFIDEIGFGKH